MIEYEEPKPYDTYRTECGRGRVTYHPEWSEDQPWVTYIDGTAGKHCCDIYAAASYFRSKGMKLQSNSK